MQTSEHLTVYQTCPLAIYQRLREALVLQGHLFESVIADEYGESAAGSFVLMRSATLSVLLTATPVADLPPSEIAIALNSRCTSECTGECAGECHSEVADSAVGTYRVGLTFDERAIAMFTQRFQNHPDHHLHLHDPSPHRSFHRASNDEKLMAQEAFVLNWSKHLATSPDGNSQSQQSVLDKQIQQSLLLNQVITRIRHSLDLPAILETTVAQVREFLSADRLVLYQFDQFDLNQLDLDALAANNLPSSDRSMVGHFVHAGHVTYESRMSETVPSVLNFAENVCFKPSRSLQARYLMGQPIAVDDVAEKYAGVPCLLSFLQQAQIKSKIIAPIIVKGRLWGLLIAHQCWHYRHWETAEAVFLQHIAEHLAVAINQSSLYQQLRQQTVSLESCVIERTQSLHDALIAAESANVTKGEFLSTMSHELRTPLTYIIGMSATLLRWSFGDLNDRQRSYLNTINQSGEQLLDIINNILEFANVESGRSLLDCSDLSLSALITAVVAQHQALADKKGVLLTLTCRLSPEADAFQADVNRLQQILSNLVNNAIKFTPTDGEVNVRVWRESQVAVFQIEDTGIGIPESQQDLLFEKFKQLESPFQRQYSGTGLGLAMTKRLVELHGGSIQVDSQVGKGSTFTVRLPANVTTRNRPLRYQVPSTLEGHKERVILLETDENNAAIACEMLTAAGYEVIWLINADQLAAQLELLQPVLLVADLSLLNPDLSKIKALQLSITALNTKVLALAQPPASVPSLMAHHDTLNKPIDPKLLVEKVRQLVVTAL